MVKYCSEAFKSLQLVGEVRPLSVFWVVSPHNSHRSSITVSFLSGVMCSTRRTVYERCLVCEPLFRNSLEGHKEIIRHRVLKLFGE